MPGPDFLDLPARTAKPRRTGITHVLDAGIPLRQAADLLDMCGTYVDVWKLGWRVAYLYPNLDAKPHLLAAHRAMSNARWMRSGGAGCTGGRGQVALSGGTAERERRHILRMGRGAGVRGRGNGRRGGVGKPGIRAGLKRTVGVVGPLVRHLRDP